MSKLSLICELYLCKWAVLYKLNIMFIANDGPDRLQDISNVAYCDLEKHKSIII
jgi:hypothetical protein